MKYHPGTRKRWDVKVHYIRRVYNNNIVPEAKGNRKENAQNNAERKHS